MVIQHNIAALNAQRNFGMHNSRMATAVERLSSGKRINRAADDPAGLAISERMRAQITALKRQQRNTMDEISLLEIKDGTFGEMQDMIRRMEELALLSMNGTFSETDRKNLDAEYQALMEGINQMGQSDAMRPIDLFGGSGTSTKPGMEGETVTFEGGNLDAFLDGLDEFLLHISDAAKLKDEDALKGLGYDSLSLASDSEKLKAAVNQFTRENAQRLLNTPMEQSKQGNRRVSVTVSANGISVDTTAARKNAYGMGGSDLLTAENAEKALGLVKNAAKTVSDQRSALGAEQNRLEHTMNVLAVMEENVTGAFSRITDADMAKEMMNYAREQLLSQASIMVMAHTRQQPQQVLSLLRQMVDETI